MVAVQTFNIKSGLTYNGAHIFKSMGAKRGCQGGTAEDIGGLRGGGGGVSGGAHSNTCHQNGEHYTVVVQYCWSVVPGRTQGRTKYYCVV